MKKRLFTILFAVLLAFAFVPIAHAEYSDMWATVYKIDGKYNGDGTIQMTPITTGITYQVLQHDSNTAETLYAFASHALTSKTNPVTTTVFAADDMVKFRVDPGETDDRYVDLIVVDTSGGFTAVVKHFDKYTHSIVIDETPGVQHHGVIWFSASSNVATDTGIDFSVGTFIHDVRVEVVTVDAGMTLNVGTADTAAGFRSGVSVAATGYIADTAVITAGDSISYYPVTTYGTLLYTAITGTGVGIDAGAYSNGGKTHLGHAVATSGTDDDLYYTGSAGSDTAAGYIHFWFTKMR